MPAECEAKCAHHRPVRLSWARLFKRVLQLDLAHCPKDSFGIGNPESRTTAAGRQRAYATFGCGRSAGTLHRSVIATYE